MSNKKKSICSFWKRKQYRKDSLLRYFSDNSNQYDLAPVYIERIDKEGNQNPKYGPVEDIANKLGDESVRNIALTGPYGSGKSSVLRTLMRDFPKANYLNISLATLEDDTLYKELIDSEAKQEGQRGNCGKRRVEEQKGKDEINHLIEYSILQQIIYKEKASKLRQSRLKRIRDIKPGKAFLIAGAIVLAIIAVLVLLEPKFLMVDSLWPFFSCSVFWKKVWDLICFAYLIGVFVYCIAKVFVSTYNSKINKLNFKDGEISIAENTSVFNKHLDEIIYFFEVTNYNVVIIEDLDRFETHHIFLKLRELNQLLNSSNSIGRRIVFVYAVRDDVFNDTNRTKFFDYITTVIPVINYSNAKDMLLNAFKERGITGIPESVCKDLGLYIDDMRMLYNIVDEYIQYSKKLGRGLEMRNLFGMIVYKNYFPKDFSALHNREGVVYRIISNKKKYQNELLSALRQKKQELEEKYAFEKVRYHSTTGKELRTLYVNRYMQNARYKILYFINNNERVSPQELIDDEEKFLKLANNRFNSYEFMPPPYYNGRNVDALETKFEDVEKQVDPQYGYLQRLNSETEIIQKRSNEIEQVEDELLTLQQKSLAQLLSSYEIALFNEDISRVEDKNRLIEFLLKAGYINEYYYDYISYFYPATLTPQDKEFVTDLRVGRKKEYDYQLIKVDSVVEELSDELYNTEGALNISLVKYISDHSNDDDEMSSILDKIIRCIIKYKADGFVFAFYSECDDCAEMFIRLFIKWKAFYINCIRDAKESNKDKKDALFEAFLRYVNPDSVSKDNVAFDTQMSESFDWINDRLDRIRLTTIEYFISERNIKFKDLNASNLNAELMQFVIDGCYFERTKQNVSSVVSFLNPSLFQLYQTASMTAIRKLDNAALIEDLEGNFQEYIDCFPAESVEESEEILLYIVNNCQTSSSIEAYLSKQTKKVSDLVDIPENEKKKLALKTNIIAPSWENIESFVKTDSDNINAVELVEFINDNIDEISKKDTSVLSEEAYGELFTHFVGSNILDFSVFREFRWAFPSHFKEYDLSALNSDRMAFLVESRGVMFDDYYYNLILNSFPTLLLQYIYAHLELFMNKLGDYYIPSNVALRLLEDSSIKKKDRMSIAHALSDEIKPSEDLAQVICRYYKEGALDDLECDKVRKYISWLKNKEDKVKYFVCFAEKENVNDEEVKSFLKELGDVYQDIAIQKGLRPKLAINSYNKELLEFLERIKFISSYKVSNNQYQVNTRSI